MQGRTCSTSAATYCARYVPILSHWQKTPIGSCYRSMAHIGKRLSCGRGTSHGTRQISVTLGRGNALSRPPGFRHRQGATVVRAKRSVIRTPADTPGGLV
ncbi:hypothetical protein V8C42DRAFT_315874 [Trichoderma barbatum]